MTVPRNATSKKNQTDVWRNGRNRSLLIFCSLLRSIIYVCFCKYVTFGNVPRSSSNFVPRDDRDNRDTSLSGSFKSPNTSAEVGQDCTHAGLISPSFNSRFSLFA